MTVCRQVQPGVFQHWQEQARASHHRYCWPSDAHSEGAGADQRLYFPPSIGREPRSSAQDRRAGFPMELCKKQLRRIGHFAEPLAVISNTPSSLDGAEPILHRPHDAMRVMPLPFEVEHRVHECSSAFGPAMCRPSSRVRRETWGCSDPWPRTGVASPPRGPGRCCREPTENEARRPSGSSRR